METPHTPQDAPPSDGDDHSATGATGTQHAGAQVGGAILLFVIGALFASIASIFIVTSLGAALGGDSFAWIGVFFPVIHLVVGVIALQAAVRQFRSVSRPVDWPVAPFEPPHYNQRSQPEGQRYEPEGAPPPSAPRDVPLPMLFQSSGVRTLAVACAIVMFFVLGRLVNFADNNIGEWALVLLGIGLVGFLSWTVLAVRRVGQTGTSTIATVIDVIQPGIKINHRPVYRCHYEFETPNGSFTGQLSTTNSDLFDLREGDQIWVLHDPVRPERNVVWPPTYDDDLL